MEASQLLAIESFSYSWLANGKSSFEGIIGEPRISLDISGHASAQEPKYRRVPSKRSLEEAQNFNFDIPTSESSLALVHADEIFCDGQILPLYGDQSSHQSFGTIGLVQEGSESSPPALSSRPICLTDRIQCHLIKWRKSSKRFLQKYLGFLWPLYWKTACSRRSIRVDDIDRKLRAVKSWNNSPVASPPRSRACYLENSCDSERRGTRSARIDKDLRKVKSCSNSPQASPGPSYSSGDWSIDSSLYEAILYCKRSIEK